jgi:hypothetical protein
MVGGRTGEGHGPGRWLQRASGTEAEDRPQDRNDGAVDLQVWVRGRCALVAAHGRCVRLVHCAGARAGKRIELKGRHIRGHTSIK